MLCIGSFLESSHDPGVHMTTGNLWLRKILCLIGPNVGTYIDGTSAKAQFSKT